MGGDLWEGATCCAGGDRVRPKLLKLGVWRQPAPRSRSLVWHDRAWVRSRDACRITWSAGGTGAAALRNPRPIGASARTCGISLEGISTYGNGVRRHKQKVLQGAGV